jgi:hypothetical protein
VTLVSSGLRDALKPVVGENVLNQRKANIKETKRVCWEVEMEGKRFFVSHTLSKTHECQDFDVKIASVYCLVRVHNETITASGNGINYKKGEDDGDGDVNKRVLDGNRSGVVGDDKRRRSSSDLDQEDQEEEEYEIQKKEAVAEGTEGNTRMTRARTTTNSILKMC